MPLGGKGGDDAESGLAALPGAERYLAIFRLGLFVFADELEQLAQRQAHLIIGLVASEEGAVNLLGVEVFADELMVLRLRQQGAALVGRAGRNRLQGFESLLRLEHFHLDAS